MFADTFQLSRYETWELDALVAQIERPNPWLLRTFFPRERLFTSRSIEFDLIDRGRRLAPFVSPMVAGKPTRREGFRTRQISPAYIKPADIVLPGDSFTRLPGEAYGGPLSPQQRFDRLVTEKLDLHLETIDNRMEWMASQALVMGGVAIEGEDYPLTYVDFGRDPSLNIALVGAAKWTQPTSSPMDDIEAASLSTRIISKGAVVSDLVMDGLSWSALKKHSSITFMINMFYRTNLPGQTQTSIDYAPRNNINEAIYVGTLNGRFNLWVYDAYYQDDQGEDQPYIPPYTVLGIARAAMEGTQYYGAIIDLDAGIEARKTFTKSDRKFDPSGLEVITQSAPIVAPRRPNAMFKLTVG
jgi:hypothetical protein